MRRMIEILVIVAFVALGLLLVTGRLPLPESPVDVQSLLPSAGSREEELASSCASCPLDCPYAGDQEPTDTSPPEDLSRVDGQLIRGEELHESYPVLSQLPLSGGAVMQHRAETPEGTPRVWIDIGTCSPPSETSEWYKRRLPSAGWKLRREDEAVVPNGVFLSFERNGDLLNLLIEARSDRTNIFLDVPRASQVP